MLDLRKAYLQLHVDRSLWKHQVVQFQGKHFFLMRLRFGLNNAPKIMNAILQKVLSLDGKISNGTDDYLDDILVNEDVVWANEVAAHLANYGLRCKEAEKVADGTKFLGLWVESSSNGSLRWKRRASVPEVGEVSASESSSPFVVS